MIGTKTLFPSLLIVVRKPEVSGLKYFHRGAVSSWVSSKCYTLFLDSFWIVQQAHLESNTCKIFFLS